MSLGRDLALLPITQDGDLQVRKLLIRRSLGGPRGDHRRELDLTVPHAYLTRALILEASATTAETAAEVERFYQRFSSTFDTALASAAIDNDQDGRIEPNEGWYRSIPVMRG
jgi:hypothetical protein